MSFSQVVPGETETTPANLLYVCKGMHLDGKSLVGGAISPMFGDNYSRQFASSVPISRIVSEAVQRADRVLMGYRKETRRRMK